MIIYHINARVPMEEAMKKRLLIGVIACETEQLMQRRLIKGITAQAYSLDMDVCVFSCITNNKDMTRHQKSEFNLFNYMNFSMLNGILYLRNSIHCEEEKQILDKMLAEQKIPVLVLDDDTPDFLASSMNLDAFIKSVRKRKKPDHT